MAEVIVVARARVQAGQEEAARSALTKNAEESRKEGGCVSYEVVRGLDDRALFMTVERWRSRADFDQHMTTPHVQALFGAIGGIVDGAPEITLLETV